MKFLQLRNAFEIYEKVTAASGPEENIGVLSGDRGQKGVCGNPPKNNGLDEQHPDRRTEIADTPQTGTPGKFQFRDRDRKKRERVDGGEILWKPVDRAAAMLVAKAPWWAHAPHVPVPVKEPKSISNSTVKPPKKKDKKMDITTSRHRHPAEGTAAIEGSKTEEQLSTEISKKFIKSTLSTLDQSNELLNKALDARAAMEVMCNSWKVEWLDFQDGNTARLNEFRMKRMAFDTECRLLMGQLREVRQFFLDENYETEITRLKEFVQTCERLKALKESGFLDTVADTMLKLAAK